MNTSYPMFVEHHITKLSYDFSRQAILSNAKSGFRNRMDGEHFDDKPKLLGNPAACVARRAELHDSHIAPLSKFVDALRAEMGSGYQIPYFDPWDGGIAAEILFLLEAPGAKAAASGFISRNNPDETAKNFFQLNQQS